MAVFTFLLKIASFGVLFLIAGFGAIQAKGLEAGLSINLTNCIVWKIPQKNLLLNE